MSNLIPRATVQTIVAERNRALSLYDRALDAILVAGEAVREAEESAARAAIGHKMYISDQAAEVKAFREAIQVPDPDQYRRTARRLLDTRVWSSIIQMTPLERLMDREAKDQLRAQMAYVPEQVDHHTKQIINGDEIARGLPEVSVENVAATLEKFQAEADTIFRRGIANAFSKLDRRFRSHDGFKVGSRVILDRAFDDGGWWNGRMRDTPMAVEHAFTVLDGKIVGETFQGAIGAIDQDRGGRWGARQSESETDYFRIRVFKNGNAHLWMLRDDLVRKVNKLLAEFYGEVIGDGNEAEEDVLKSRKLTPARNFGFFPTPDEAAERLLRDFPNTAALKEPRLRFLEPSAGTGQLARRCADVRWEFSRWSGGVESARERYHLNNDVDCVEIQPALAAALQAEGLYRRVLNRDFLTLDPATTGLYDRVVMNPPFDRERDIDHVTHALDFLKPEGCLTAIMSAGTEFRETRKAVAFRALMQRLNAHWSDLPGSSFAESGTYVNTVYVKVWKDGRNAR